MEFVIVRLPLALSMPPSVLPDAGLAELFAMVLTNRYAASAACLMVVALAHVSESLQLYPAARTSGAICARSVAGAK